MTCAFCSDDVSTLLTVSKGQNKNKKVQMLCCVADTPSQLKIIIISVENV